MKTLTLADRVYIARYYETDGPMRRNGMLQKMGKHELRKIADDTSLDYDIRIEAEKELIRREREWHNVERPYWEGRMQRQHSKSI